MIESDLYQILKDYRNKLTEEIIDHYFNVDEYEEEDYEWVWFEVLDQAQTDLEDWFASDYEELDREVFNQDESVPEALAEKLLLKLREDRD